MSAEEEVVWRVKLVPFAGASVQYDDERHWGVCCVCLRVDLTENHYY